MHGSVSGLFLEDTEDELAISEMVSVGILFSEHILLTTNLWPQSIHLSLIYKSRSKQL